MSRKFLSNVVARTISGEVGKEHANMHEITPSNNHLINVRWEVSKRSDFFIYDIVTSKCYYHSKQLKKDGTPKAKAKPKCNGSA